MKRALRLLSFAALASALATGCVLYSIQHTLIYNPRRYADRYLENLPLQVTPLRFATTSGKQTSYYVQPRSGEKGLPGEVWVVFGGNGSLALDWLELISNYSDLRAGFLLVEYPGFGINDGVA